jgi:UDP-N-acetylmuramyl pentapeptide phosphotransferase/UDP-N-acetylglucosamine-1-phosphate transferase
VGGVRRLAGRRHFIFFLDVVSTDRIVMIVTLGFGAIGWADDWRKTV